MGTGSSNNNYYQSQCNNNNNNNYNQNQNTNFNNQNQNTNFNKQNQGTNYNNQKVDIHSKDKRLCEEILKEEIESEARYRAKEATLPARRVAREAVDRAARNTPILGDVIQAKQTTNISENILNLI